MPFLKTIHIGGPKVLHDDRGEWISSIARDRAEGPVVLQKSGLEGDGNAQPYHGSPGAAVCVHPCDHYRFWNREYGMDLQPGCFGENFTLEGQADEDICAGDIVRVGSAVVQVSGPRVPCANLARRIGRSDWVRLTIRENRTGFYLRVLLAGSIQEGDAWQLQERLNENASIAAINRCMYTDFNEDAARMFAALPGLEAWWQEQFQEKLARKPHWTDGLAG